MNEIENKSFITASELQSDLEFLEDEALLAELGVLYELENGITKLTHVRPWHQRKAPERVARQQPCSDFNVFKPMFLKVQQDLKLGVRKTFKFRNNAEINLGDFFILGGQKVYVAALGKQFQHEDGRADRRLRLIYDNATESDILLRSLQRALYKDKTSRRVSPIQ